MRRQLSAVIKQQPSLSLSPLLKSQISEWVQGSLSPAPTHPQLALCMFECSVVDLDGGGKISASEFMTVISQLQAMANLYTGGSIRSADHDK